MLLHWKFWKEGGSETGLVHLISLPSLIWIITTYLVILKLWLTGKGYSSTTGWSIMAKVPSVFYVVNGTDIRYGCKSLVTIRTGIHVHLADHSHRGWDQKDCPIEVTVLPILKFLPQPKLRRPQSHNKLFLERLRAVLWASNSERSADLESFETVSVFFGCTTRHNRGKSVDQHLQQ